MTLEFRPLVVTIDTGVNLRVVSIPWGGGGGGCGIVQ